MARYRKRAYAGKYRTQGFNKRMRPMMANSRIMAIMNCIEKKYFDKILVRVSGTTTVNTISTTTPAVISLISEVSDSVIAAGSIKQGPGASQRVGDKIFITNFQIKGNLFVDSASFAKNGQFVKAVVVVDKQCNGGEPEWDDLYMTTWLFAHRDLANVGRYQILKEKTFFLTPMNSIDGQTTYASRKLFKINYTFRKPLRVDYENDPDGNSTGFTGEISKNNVFLLLATTSGTGIVTYDLNCRVRFTD